LSFLCFRQSGGFQVCCYFLPPPLHRSGFFLVVLTVEGAIFFEYQTPAALFAGYACACQWCGIPVQESEGEEFGAFGFLFPCALSSVSLF
jgi:hypothetical protein